MPETLTRGQLVEIAGSKEPLDTPEALRGEAYSGPVTGNGDRGQLTEWSEDLGAWTVATFSATFVTVKEEYLRPLNSADVADFDIALGPASDAGVLGSELADSLASKGFASAKLFVSPEDLAEMVAAADRGVQDSAFQRLAAELEQGYLGIDGTGKTLALTMDDDTAFYIKDSPLVLAEQFLDAVGTYMRPFVEGTCGFEIYSQSTTMMVLPFAGDEEDYMPPDLENEDAAQFLSMMWRARLQVIMNCGPNDATLTLLSKADGGPEEQVLVKPGMLAIFAVEQFRFTYKPDGKALMLTTWYLDQPRQYVVDQITGDVQAMLLGASGPPPPQRTEHLGVVSMSTRYAFGVDEPWKLWVAYSKAGWDTMTRHPFQRWDCDMYYDPGADQTSGLSYTCHGGFSDGIELFDCRFFDISPAEARTMDPTQRQVLEVSYVALQGAGWTKRMLQQKPAQIASFVGLDKNEWNGMPKDASGGFGASSSANAITSNRFNYCMNLKGASMTIDTACSSSLVCTHTGKLYLLHKHYDPCEAVIVCGVNLSLSPLTYIGGCGAGMHSHLGRCFTYNFSADGYARGEATAASGFKLRNWDRESGDFCLLAGSQVNQDGRSASLTAPNGPSQERCSKAVLTEIGIKPPEVDTTECHGTGTSLGDPIEIGAYRKVMAVMPRPEPVIITSSKSNIGHCEGSAGISGLLKCCLMNFYNEATPNVHLNCLNPHLDMDGFPGVITTEGGLFRSEATYNGVLSFGFGGTNACAMTWGPNLGTSRSAVNTDMYALVVKKMQDSPAQEVTITGDDWEDWEMDGPGRYSKPGDIWELEFDEDGTVSWFPKEKDAVDLGDSYYISGTFNDWTFDVMDADDTVGGLFTALVTLGPTGKEEFQIVADQEPGMTFYPDVPQCTIKSVEVKGPAEKSHEYSWALLGDAGDRFRVEFYKSEADTVSVSWVKMA